MKHPNAYVAGKEISVSGRWFKTAKLRHEWCDFFDDPLGAVELMRSQQIRADLFTFVPELSSARPKLPFLMENVSIAVLPVSTFAQWWEDIGFKTRNKIRKSQKGGLELRIVELTDEFAKEVESIYSESPIRQGRKFFHYGQRAKEIKEELSSFSQKSTIVGSYFQGELIGFMKLYLGNDVLRTIHIVAKLAHRDKCAMDALVAKAVELCEANNVHHLHYGSWTEGGIGVFRIKHLFERREVPRYFVPLNRRGDIMLRLQLQRPLRERLPRNLVASLTGFRARWNALKIGQS